VPFTINARQRWALHQQIRDDLTGLGDLVLALERDEGEEARRLRDRYVGEMRLLDDLGWSEQASAREYVVTVEPARLAATLQGLSHAAADAARVHVHEGQGAQNAAELSARICQDIGDVLAELVILGDGTPDDAQPIGGS
jgi:hypothetical protein